MSKQSYQNPAVYRNIRNIRDITSRYSLKIVLSQTLLVHKLLSKYMKSKILATLLNKSALSTYLLDFWFYSNQGAHNSFLDKVQLGHALYLNKNMT